MKVIGLTGLNASGKGTIAGMLVEKGFSYFSLSDILRDILKERKLEASRDNLVAVGNEVRAKKGAGALAQILIERLRKEKGEKFVVDSIRNPHEIMELRKLDSFTLVVMDAEPKKRYERAMKRGRDESAVTFEDFIMQENRERSKDQKAQQLHKCIEMGDITIENNGSIEDLKKAFSRFSKSFL